jgi:hypothetical protein
MCSTLRKCLTLPLKLVTRAANQLLFPPKVLQRLSGHKDITVLLGYIMTDTTDVAEALGRLSKVKDVID